MRTRFRIPDGAPLVGRGEELRRLTAAFDGARRGAGGLVLLFGEPGIGKTRLAGELSDRAAGAGAAVGWGQAPEGGDAAPYDLWLQALRALPPGEDLAAATSALAADAVTMAPAGAEDAVHARFRLFDAVGLALRMRAADRPLVVVLDDLHWGDHASLLLLRFVARELTDAAVLLIATVRDVEMRLAIGPSLFADLATAGDVIPLAGLSADEVARLVADRTGDTSSPALCSAIHQASEGNPFFVGELLHVLADGGELPEGAIPESVRELLERRMRPLRDAPRTLLEVAAVVGREFDVATVARAAATTPAAVLEACDDAARFGLVAAVPETVGGHRFTHALVRQAVYASLAPARRAALHARVGELLEALPVAHRTPRLAEIARHFLACADPSRAARAVVHARAAGELALARHSYEEAARHFGQALDAVARCGDDVRERIGLQLARADALWRADDASARAAYLATAETARPVDPTLFAAAVVGYAYTFASDTAGVPDPTMMALLEDALAVVPTTEAGWRAQLMARIAQALSFDPDGMERRLALSAEALVLARRSDDPLALQRALLVRHFMLLGPGRVDEPLQLCTELLAASDATGHVVAAMQARMLRVPLWILAGDTAAADLDIAAAFTTAETTRLPFCRWWARSLHAMRALMIGRLDEAERWALESMAFLPEVQDPYPPQAVASQFFAIRRAQGRAGELAAQLTMLADLVLLPVWRCALALIHVELGHPTAALAELDAIGGRCFADLPQDGTWLTGLAMAAEAAHRLGARAHAAALYEQLLPFEAAPIMSGSAVCLGVAARYLGLLALTLERWPAAVAHLDRAVTLLQRVDDRVQLAHARAEAAVALRRRDRPGDRARAASLAAAAQAAAREFGLTALDARITADAASDPSDDGATAALATLRRDDDSWLVGWTHAPQRLADGKGVRYLARLLARPGETVTAVDLTAHEAPDEPRATAEHARVNVTRRLRQAIDRIEALSPDLGRHLAACVRTGTRCVYEPDPRQPVTWVL